MPYIYTWATDDKGKTKSSYYAPVAHEQNLSINSKYFIQNFLSPHSFQKFKNSAKEKSGSCALFNDRSDTT
jgi:hypothetical protein